jgi:hypothetical protein
VISLLNTLSFLVFCHVFYLISEDFLLSKATALTSIMDDIYLRVEWSGFLVA